MMLFVSMKESPIQLNMDLLVWIRSRESLDRSTSHTFQNSDSTSKATKTVLKKVILITAGFLKR